jgi:hypothetical protein
LKRRGWPPTGALSAPERLRQAPSAQRADGRRPGSQSGQGGRQVAGPLLDLGQRLVDRSQVQRGGGSTQPVERLPAEKPGLVELPPTQLDLGKQPVGGSLVPRLGRLALVERAAGERFRLVDVPCGEGGPRAVE